MSHSLRLLRQKVSDGILLGIEHYHTCIGQSFTEKESTIKLFDLTSKIITLAFKKLPICP